MYTRLILCSALLAACATTTPARPPAQTEVASPVTEEVSAPVETPGHPTLRALAPHDTSEAAIGAATIRPLETLVGALQLVVVSKQVDSFFNWHSCPSGQLRIQYDLDQTRHAGEESFVVECGESPRPQSEYSMHPIDDYVPIGFFTCRHPAIMVHGNSQTVWMKDSRSTQRILIEIGPGATSFHTLDSCSMAQ